MVCAALCLYSDEGYVAIKPCSALWGSQGVVSLIPVVADQRTLAEKLRDMIQILEGTDQLFWAKDWSVYIENEIPGEDREVWQPLWQIFWGGSCLSEIFLWLCLLAN